MNINTLRVTTPRTRRPVTVVEPADGSDMDGFDHEHILFAHAKAQSTGRVLMLGGNPSRYDISNQLGVDRIPLREIGPMRADGRRRADQGLATSSTGSVATVRKSVLKHLARRDALIADAESTLENQRQSYWHDRAADTIAREEAAHQYELEQAIGCLAPNLATSDCPIDDDFISWLLTYQRMLEGDENYETTKWEDHA